MVAAQSSAMVVDDEPDVRHSLAGGLTFEGYDVTTAPDGGRALGLLAEAARWAPQHLGP